MKKLSNQELVEKVLKIAVAGEFIGHGVFALQVKAGWIPYFVALGISAETATTLLPLIGALDILLAIIILIKPVKAVLLWMVFWGVWTALIRPLAGEPIWDFVERSANWGGASSTIAIKRLAKIVKRLV